MSPTRATGSVVLCAEEEALRHPGLLGLDGERVEACSWLRTYSKASELRNALREEPASCEVWVASADDMDGLNVAAALKHDRSDHRVSLVATSLSGSGLSRAKAAGVDEVLPPDAFARRYAEEKRMRADAMNAQTPQAVAMSAATAVDAPAAARAAATTAAMPAAATAMAAPAAMTQRMEPISRNASQRPMSSPRAADGRRGAVLVVASGAGGVGKSAVSVTAAHVAAARGQRVLLVDGDLQFGDCALLCGAQRGPSVDAVLADMASLGRLEPAAGQPAVIGAPGRLELAEVLVPQLPSLLEAAAPLFDLVVLNTGVSWSEGHLSLIERSTATVMLVGQRVASVRGCQRAVDLCRRCGIATGQLAYAVNRCARNGLLTSVDVSCALDGAHVLELKDGGQEVEELLGAGTASALAVSRNPFVQSIEELLDCVLGEKAMRGGVDAGNAASRKQAAPAASQRRRKRAKEPKGPRRAMARRDAAAPAPGFGVPFGMGEALPWA